MIPNGFGCLEIHDHQTKVKARQLIHKRFHGAPSLTDIDPAFGVEFNDNIHGDMLRKELDIAHLSQSEQLTLTNLVKKF